MTGKSRGIVQVNKVKYRAHRKYRETGGQGGRGAWYMVGDVCMAAERLGKKSLEEYKRAGREGLQGGSKTKGKEHY